MSTMEIIRYPKSIHISKTWEPNSFDNISSVEFQIALKIFMLLKQNNVYIKGCTWDYGIKRGGDIYNYSSISIT